MGEVLAVVGIVRETPDSVLDVSQFKVGVVSKMERSELCHRTSNNGAYDWD